jgi:predicted dienelactone hydrolase
MLSRLCFVASILLFLAGAAVPDARADYPVGTSDVTFVDPDRAGRSVPCDLYYPAQSAGQDAPVADPPATGFAAVAFGHGFQIPASAYAWVAGRLAAIGCVVAVPRTETSLFPDHNQFGLDLAFVTRALRDEGAEPASPFYGRMGSRTLVMGHSMGGGCSVLAAASDPSITAVANFAAAETNPSAIAACSTIDRPALLFAGTNDCVTPPADHQVPMYTALAGWRTLVTINGASHCQFNAYSFLCDLGESCNATISAQVQQDLVWLLLEPWTRYLLFLDPAAAQEYQALLAAGTGWTYQQSGQPTAVHTPSRVPAGRIAVHPNPFTSTLMLNVDIAAGGPARVAIYDVAGRRVSTLLDTRDALRGYSLRWDGRDANGRDLPSGVYFARLVTDHGHVSAKLVLVR